jgi:hypothetical protein
MDVVFDTSPSCAHAARSVSDAHEARKQKKIRGKRTGKGKSYEQFIQTHEAQTRKRGQCCSIQCAPASLFANVSNMLPRKMALCSHKSLEKSVAAK